MRRSSFVIAASIGLPVALFAASSAAQEASGDLSPTPAQPVPVSVVDSEVAPATSGASGEDVVIRLKGGATLRGSLVELKPGDHATIVLAPGTQARIEWSGIEGVDKRADEGEAEDATAASSLRVTTVVREEPAVLVHVDSKESAVLVSRDGSERCVAPCDNLLPLNGSYRIIGRRIESSGWFQLAGSPGDRVVIQVSPGRKSTFREGTVIGATGFVVGGVGAWIAKIAGEHTDEVWSTGTKLGAGVMVSGLVTMGVGGALMLANHSSRGSQEVQARSEEPPGDEPPRQAVWRAPDLLERALPRADQVQLANWTF